MRVGDIVPEVIRSHEVGKNRWVLSGAAHADEARTRILIRHVKVALLWNASCKVIRNKYTIALAKHGQMSEYSSCTIQL